MDKHTKLNMLLSSLFESNALSTWIIFEDKSGIVNVRLRFTKCGDMDSVENVSFWRKSEGQRKSEHPVTKTRVRRSLQEVSPLFPKIMWW